MRAGPALYPERYVQLLPVSSLLLLCTCSVIEKNFFSKTNVEVCLSADSQLFSILNHPDAKVACVGVTASGSSTSMYTLAIFASIP